MGSAVLRVQVCVEYTHYPVAGWTSKQ